MTFVKLRQLSCIVKTENLFYCENIHKHHRNLTSLAVHHAHTIPIQDEKNDLKFFHYEQHPLFFHILYKPGNFLQSFDGNTIPYQCQRRFFSTKPTKLKKPSKAKSYFVEKYAAYMAWVGKGMEKRYPKLHGLYAHYKQGISSIFKAMKTYTSVAADLKLNKKAIHEFSYYELTCYKHTLHDVIKVLPVLLIAALPFAPYVIFPIAHMFPRQLLCRHFWTPEQQLEYAELSHAKRCHHAAHIISYLQRQGHKIRDPALRQKFCNSVDDLLRGVDSNAKELIELLPAFERRPFSLLYLSRLHKIHKWHLARSLYLSTFRSTLTQDLTLLHHLDKAMVREGLESLSVPQLREACLYRGFNPAGVSDDDLKTYLRSWINVSENIDDRSLSVLIHAPYFLAYNARSNVKHQPPRSHHS